MVEEMAETAAKVSVEETVEVVAVVPPSWELARAESTVGGGDAEDLLSSMQRSTGGVVVTVVSVVEVCFEWSMTCVVKGLGVIEALLPSTSPCDWGV
jgi:hypothetical protein